MDPHDPNDPPNQYRSTDAPCTIFSPSAPEFGGPQRDADWNMDLTDAEKRCARRLYEGEVSYVDNCIGRLTSLLSGLGLDNRTYVCVTADHGEEFWDHGGYYHGRTMYEEVIRVPFIVAGPGVEHQVIDAPVSAIDVMPTLAGLLGLGPQAGWLGHDLTPVLTRGADAGAFRLCYARGTNFKQADTPLEMVVSGDHKLIFAPASDDVKLYDLATDPGENRDLASQNQPLAERLLRQLKAWSAQYPSDLRPADDRDRLRKDGDLERRLRSVGYLD